MENFRLDATMLENNKDEYLRLFIMICRSKGFSNDKISIIRSVFEFGYDAHKDQKRKYSGDMYFTHCVHVAMILMKYVDDLEYTAVCAALLHDVVEDTETSINTVKRLFGEVIARMVSSLTEVRGYGMNRKTRHKIYNKIIEHSDSIIHSIKCADLISNTSDIVENDAGFAVVYLKEKVEALKCLTGADDAIYKAAFDQIAHSKTELNIR